MRSSSINILRRLINSSGPGLSRQSATVCRMTLISSPFHPVMSARLFASSVPSRAFSSSSGSENICLVNTKEQFAIARTKIEVDSAPAILYFTAAWCGPCRFMSPVLESLSGKYPDVTIYKIDIDQENIQDKLLELRIDSVPRLHFFKDGKKVDEIIGADVGRLKYTMEKLYE
ncbi:hypothetical protein SAY87_006564 [Trapa incisa]|uniref:Thioredoxin domain-containing protein n=1 Tax=Trapa incisa TaxID=236973 RepID=A0AAN7PYI2_9MYRT|nr:hypothetical protein SAY87_006564 [Trapa incisa]